MLGLVAIYLRYVLPESPRWLMTHGRNDEAEKIVTDIERAAERQGVQLEAVPDSRALEVTARKPIGYIETARIILRDYPGRAFLGFSMMVTQAFVYNAIFFSNGSVLHNFYHVKSDNLGYYFFPFAIGNLLGPLTIGHLFDTIGRRRMIMITTVYRRSCWPFRRSSSRPTC